jgi:hypothetical protein
MSAIQPDDSLPLDLIDVIKLDEIVVLVALILVEYISVVHTNVLRQFSVLLQISSLVCHVLQNNVCLFILHHEGRSLRAIDTAPEGNSRGTGSFAHHHQQCNTSCSAYQRRLIR